MFNEDTQDHRKGTVIYRLYKDIFRKPEPASPLSQMSALLHRFDALAAQEVFPPEGPEITFYTKRVLERLLEGDEYKTHSWQTQQGHNLTIITSPNSPSNIRLVKAPKKVLD